ncbi:PIN domain-containing protein [Streptomyces fuscichromogenes]|uniref:DUF4935 domain-containing protein n=1 Tax=Streptomyces fuscichromogenes TaxID=1324013 RepID=A0A917XPI4_9ACTN|nr:PIN domain-containing protein [Streptomyces fuscichromogenes]GGN46729.1 hypothetical protein GCM10011578_099810 [Streptomyces fuscichromogenes]
MIILDTCVLTDQQHNSPIWELLYALRQSGTERIALPEMVLVELLAQRERTYEEALRKAHDSYAQLWKMQFGESDGAEHWPAVELVDWHVNDWRALYERTFEILPLTLEAAREGLWREARRRRPAKESGKEGSRDAAIWATVLEAAQQEASKAVSFVTRNSKDFGPNETLHPELAAEVADAGVTVEYLSDLKKVVGRFAERHPVAHDDARLRARISEPSTVGWLHRFVVDDVTSGPFEARIIDLGDEASFPSWVDFEQWLGSPVVEILGWSDAADYVAAGVSRLATTLKVLATGFARRIVLETEELVAFTVDVRVMFGKDSLTVLSFSDFHSIEDDDEPAVAAAARRASTVIQQAAYD